MAISCGKLSMGIVGADCDNPLVSGLRPDVILINHDDIDLSLTTIENGILTDIVLKKDGTVSRKGVKAEMLPKTTTSTIALAKGAYANGWDQNLTLRILDLGPEVKKFIQQLAKSRVIAIVANNHINYSVDPTDPIRKKGDTVFEAYGFYTGLMLNENSRDTEDNDTRGGYIVTLGCGDNAKEPSLPITVFKTSLDLTEGLVASLA